MQWWYRVLGLIILVFPTPICLAQMVSTHIGPSATPLIGGLPSAGGELIFNIGPQVSFGGSFHTFSLDTSGLFEDFVEDEDKNAEVDVEEGSLQRVMGLAQIKFYPFMGSFNIGLLAGMATVTSVLRADSEDTGDSVNEERTYRQTVGGFTVGNRWRWQHFFVGIDWLGYLSVFSSDKEVEGESSARYSEAFGEAYESYDDFTNAVGERGGPIALVASIGTGF